MGAKYWSETLSKGSSGDSTKEWQNFLKSQGYDLAVDGIFGDITTNYTIDWQTKNGLDADGIVGAQTWGKAGYSDIATPISAPTISLTTTAPTFSNISFADTTDGEAAFKAKTDADKAVADYKDFTWDDQGKYDTLFEEYEKRPDFSYDFNADALYQQYKDKYIQQGKMAMADTIGQASAMTGGYGNSYAATAGNQAYQSHLQNLNDIIPELYQMAYDRYNQKGQDMLNMLGLLGNERDFAYGVWGDEYDRLVDQRTYANTDFYNAADLFNTDQDRGNSLEQKDFENELGLWEANTDNALKTAEFNESVRRYEDERSTSTSTGGGSGSGSGSGTGSGGGNGGTGGSSYDNGGYGEDIVKKAQDFVGASADGKWGNDSATKAKANGYNSLAEVVAAMGGKDEEEGFTGGGYKSAVEYMKSHGVPSANASGVMTQGEWIRRKGAYYNSHQGSADVKNFDSYEEYLKNFVQYAIETYGS